MATLTAPQSGTLSSNTLMTIAVAGIAGAVVDAIYFSTIALLKGNSPVKVLQSIAGFWFGSRTFDLGDLSAIVGAATHIGLATLMAAGFVILALRTDTIRKKPIATGLAYGLLLYAIMYQMVMPLRWPAIYPKWDGARSVLDIGIHCVIGVVFAMIVRARFFQPETGC